MSWPGAADVLVQVLEEVQPSAVGVVNVSVAATKLGMRRLAYARSLAAYGPMNEGRGFGDSLHCALIPAERMIFAHFGISSLILPANSSGRLPTGS